MLIHKYLLLGNEDINKNGITNAVDYKNTYSKPFSISGKVRKIIK